MPDIQQINEYRQKEESQAAETISAVRMPFWKQEASKISKDAER